MVAPLVLLLSCLLLSFETCAAEHPAKKRSHVKEANGIPFQLTGYGKWNTGGGRSAMDIHIEIPMDLPIPTPGVTSSQLPTSGVTESTGSTGSTGSTSSSSLSTSPTPPTSSSTAPSSEGAFSAEEQEGLEAHNKFRAVHGSPAMTLNRKMCDEAAAYAQKIAASGNMKHSSREERSGQGENLAMGCSTNKAQTMTEAVTNWYNEVCDPGYNFQGGRGQSGTGHFTQVVWKDSLQLGIGRAEVTRDGMKCAYIVGRYEPLGNFDTGNDDYAKNVQEGSFNRNQYCSSVRDQGNQRKGAKLRHIALFGKHVSRVVKRSHLHKKPQ